MSRLDYPITTLLEEIAIRTWRWLRASAELELSINEESITDFHLLRFKEYERSSGIGLKAIWKCPKAQEAKIGIDWQWTIGSDLLGWRRYAIQAKRLSRRTGSVSGVQQAYDSIRHTNPKGDQIDLLLEYSVTSNAVPIYCLYNFVEISSYKPYWHCCEPFETEREQEELLGCTIIPAEQVKELWHHRGFWTFERVHNHPSALALPLRCLMCQQRQETGSNLDQYSSMAQKTPDEVMGLRQTEMVELLYSSAEEIYTRLNTESVPKAIMIIEVEPAVKG